MPSIDTQARLESVIVRLAGRIFLQDVEGTIREITADVVARNTIGSRDSARRVAGRSSARAVRGSDLGLAGLAEVKEPPESVALRSNVPHLQYCLAGELLLEVQVVVLHVGGLDIAVEAKDVALKAARGRGRKERAPEADRPAHHARRKNRIGTNIVVGRAGIEERRIGQVAKRHVLREGVEEQAESGAHHRSTFSRYVPRSAHARRKVLLVRIVKAAQARLTHLREGEATAGEIKTRHIAQQVVLFLDDAKIIPPQTIAKCQPRGCPETVLHVETEVVLVGVAGGVSEILEAAIHESLQKILDGRTCLAPVETQPSAEVLVEILLDRCTVIINAELNIVFVHLPGKAVEDLVVAIDAMARQAAGGAELSNSTHQHDGQAGIERTAAIAQRSISRRAKSNRAGVEILVRREEPFRKAVPAVAQLIHLVRTDRAHVGKRHQLHSRGSEGIKAWQLAA